MSILNFELYVCQCCGEFTIGRNICTFCGAPTIGTVNNICDIANKNIDNTKAVKNSIDDLIGCYYHSDITNTRDQQRQRKERAKRLSQTTWDVLKKGNMKVCPICGHIAGVSCFYDNSICCVCGSAYLESKTSCIKYYSRDEYSTAYFQALQEKTRKCVYKNPPDQAMVNRRIEVEKDRLPDRIEIQAMPEILPNIGVISALINTNSGIRTASSRIWQIYLDLQTYISHHLYYIDNSSIDSRYAIMRLREFLSDSYNVLRLQYFAGQQELVDILLKYVSDLSWQLSTLDQNCTN